jgi:hypothetical protein
MRLPWGALAFPGGVGVLGVSWICEGIVDRVQVCGRGFEVVMGYGIEFLVALIILLNGARTDLLDAIPTGAYWKAKGVTVTVEQLERDAGPDERVGAIDELVGELGAAEFKARVRAKEKLVGMGAEILPQLQGAMESKNPEVRAVAEEIARRFEAKGKERAVRRLMAIRTLGERGEKGALEMLKGLEGSKEMFVGEYASRAVARIEGRAWERPDRSGEIKEDWKLLPRHTGIVGQTTGLAMEEVTVEKLAGGKEEAEGKVMEGLLPVVERIGNVRIDGVTAGLSDDAGETTGWELTIIRGEFDAHALLGAARVLAHPADGVVKYGEEHGIPIVQTDVDTHVMFPSDRMMILVMADEEKDRFARMLALVYALEAGHGTVTGDKELQGLIGKVPGPGTAAPLWLAGTFNAEEKRAKLLAGVDSFTLSGVKKHGAMALTLRAEGEDAGALKGSVEELNADVQWLKGVMPAGPGLAPIAGFVGSVHGAVGGSGKEATVTGEVKAGVPAAVLGIFLPMVDLKGEAGQPGAVAPNGPAAMPGR